MKINILGTEYEVSLINRSDDKRFSEDTSLGGICDFSVHKIKILNQEVASKNEICVQEDVRAIENQVLLHEIAHAFLKESGLDDEAQDEKLCDWLSIQVPKMFKTYTEAVKLLNSAHKELAPQLSDETLEKIVELTKQKIKHK